MITTRIPRWPRRLVAAALAVGALAIAAGALAIAGEAPPAAAASSTAAPALPTGYVTMLAQHGFGDPQNNFAWSMAWFKGKLYVGTGRDVKCVENVTDQFYFPFENNYVTNPAPDTHCPRNPYNLDLRAEIWQYTPHTGTWRMVYRAPADIRNPRARGKYVARDIAYRGMTVMRGSDGRQALFISGVTTDEYLPELAHSHPPRLLRTYDGLHFHDIAVPIIVHYVGEFFDHRPIGFRGLQVWNHRLYVLASTALTGDGAVFEVRNPFADKAQFTQVSPPNIHVFEMETFDGRLYFGSGSFAHGYGVYRTLSTRVPSHAPWKLKAVVTGGAGNPQQVSVVSMHAFKGHLYVGAAGWWHPGTGLAQPPAELIRIGHRDGWEVVAGDPRKGPDGQWRYPISGLPGGFGNSFNAHLWRITDEGGALFVGTNDWSWDLKNTKAWAPKAWRLVSRVLQPGFGFDLWKSCDGVTWSPVTRNAFGVDSEDFGVRTLVPVPSSDGFILGTANIAHGTRIWQAHGLSSCGAPSGRAVRATAGSVQPPQNLLTDVQAGGTVLSWEPSPGAVTYRVERAQYVDAPLSLRPPPAIPNAFSFDDAVPVSVPSGTPGSLDVSIPVLGPFYAVGTTPHTVFVDQRRAPGARYVYRVVAQTASGATSAPSNLQQVPDLRPPATFAQLARAAHGSVAVAAIAQARGDRAGVLARLARLARTAGNDELAELAYRLARRLRYANVAARPASSG
ncbi:MAG: hypothetical protein WBQ18_17790 [Solirubrobacteraceae bacterium]